MMLPTDIALIHDPIFKDYVEEYAKDQSQFFNDFAAAYSKVRFQINLIFSFNFIYLFLI